MKARGWRLEGGTVRAFDPAAHDCAAADGGFLWVHIEGTGEEIAPWLAHVAGLGEIVVGALTATETRPRCDAIGQGALVNLRGLASEPDEVPDALASVRLFAERARVISVSRVELSATPVVAAAMEAGALTDPGDLVTAYARAITERLDPEVAALGDSLDDCEEAIDAREAWRFRRAVATARREAIGYRRFVEPERQALARLAELDCGWIDEHDRLHLREAADRFARMGEELESVRERAALMHDQLTDLRAEVIETRSLLVAVVALVFLPLTFLTGLLGMNVGGIPYADQPWAFWGVVGVCAVTAVALAAFFKAAHWFRG